jgi:flagellar protein FliL
MSAAAAPATDAGAAAPAKKGKKKLIIMVAVALLVVLGAGGGAAIYFKKKAAHAAEEGDEPAPAAEHQASKRDPKHPPVFLPLDPFVVNLADKEADRYAQIGITLELQDAKFGDELKLYMPAIRNGILMILAHKSSAELLERSGKELLAAQVQREAARTMGINVADAAADENATDEKAAHSPSAKTDDTSDGDDEKRSKKAKKQRKAATEPNPILHVHFSNFIIQ